jgi:hypothetical protein
VSRLFSRFQDDGVIKVHLREIELLNSEVLRTMAACAAESQPASAWAHAA